MQKTILIFLLLVPQFLLAQLQQMTLEDAVLGRHTYLSPETLNGLTWKNDQVFTWEENGALMAEDAKNGKKTVLLTVKDANAVLKAETDDQLQSFSGYLWTEKEALLLQRGNHYYVLDIDAKSVIWHVEIPAQAENAVLNERGQFVAYTIGDDLYASFSDGKQVQITNDGGNGIVNGKSVHRNEFGIRNGIFPSAEGNYIAFYRMDESMVTDYPVVDFMTRVAEHTPIKYPMAGMMSHHVTVGVYNIATGKVQFLNTGEPFDRYFTNITWSPDEQSLYIAELNREQDHMKLNRYDVASGNKELTLFEEKNSTYVEPLHPLLFSDADPDEFYYLSRRDGWFHVYKYSVTGELKSQVTRGEWETARILGFSGKEKYMFIEAHKESPLELHIYRVETKSGKTEKLTAVEGVHRGILSKEGSYIIHRFSAPEIPSQTGLISANGKVRRTLHSAENPLKNHQLGENRLVPILSADGNTELTGRLILPVDFNPAKKYPVIIYVYGGPHSQLVDKSWLNGANWWQYYMASKGYIAFTMDNRGTNNRGREFESSIHRQLGILETADQMKGVEYLRSLPYVDEERIGVHGWSYGGFMTLNMMLRHPGVFKVGVAGGPVVDWSMYEVMYGERYMDRPQENPEGYDGTNMLNHVDKLEDHLMLIHGVQDDVVVMQHSMKFLRECVKQEKQVDFFAYPTHPHNVRGKDRVHLMEKISRYFIENLNQKPEAEEVTLKFPAR
ncbi:MAG: DPP IV N-terminal domain-containing protein [Mariniphaga sp.]